MTAPDATVRRLHVWSGLIVLGVFLGGAATGAGVYAWFHPAHHRFRPPGGDVLFGPLRELNLSPDQERKAKAILEKHHEAMEAMLKETFPRMRAAQEQMDRELRAILTEEQAKKFDEIRARRPPPPPGGPGRFGPRGFGPPPGAPPAGPPPPGPAN
jgi:hypothetical protein